LENTKCGPIKPGFYHIAETVVYVRIAAFAHAVIVD
jgi:hypothetical protein